MQLHSGFYPSASHDGPVSIHGDDMWLGLGRIAAELFGIWLAQVKMPFCEGRVQTH
jgi:hypothetical protein